MAPSRSTRVDVEHEVGDRDLGSTVQHPLAESREAREAVGRGGELAIEHEPVWEVGDLRDDSGHVPSASRADAQPVMRADDRAEAVELDLERPAVADRQPAGARHHGRRERAPQQSELELSSFAL